MLFVGIIFANLLRYSSDCCSVGTEPLSGRNTGKYAGKVPVYVEVPERDAISGINWKVCLLSLMQYSNGTKTDNKTAEKFSAYALNTIPGEDKSEEVVLYGVEPDSKYIKADSGRWRIYIDGICR